MIDPAVMRAMLNAGCTADQIVAVAEDAARAVEAKKAEKRAGNAERQRRFRERNAMSRVTDVTNGYIPSPKKETSPTPPKEKITPSTVSEARASSTETRAGFDAFWSLFPNKVGKPDAERKFGLALKRASFAEIMDGLDRYVAKTDDRPWCNPATWLNQDRWADQPALPLAQRAAAPAPRQAHNEILDAIIRGETNVPTSPTIDGSYERTDSGSAASPVRLYALPSGRR